MLSRPVFAASRARLRFARTALLWLALVMALAQVVAIRHAYSHAPGESSSQSGAKHPGGLAHCEVCRELRHEVAMSRIVPEMMVRIDDGEVGLEDVFRKRHLQPALVRRRDQSIAGYLSKGAHAVGHVR